MSYITSFPSGFSVSVDVPLDKRTVIADISAADTTWLRTAYVGLITKDSATGNIYHITETDGTQGGLAYETFGLSADTRRSIIQNSFPVTVDSASTAEELLCGNGTTSSIGTLTEDMELAPSDDCRCFSVLDENENIDEFNVTVIFDSGVDEYIISFKDTNVMFYKNSADIWHYYDYRTTRGGVVSGIVVQRNPSALNLIDFLTAQQLAAPDDSGPRGPAPEHITYTANETFTADPFNNGAVGGMVELFSIHEDTPDNTAFIVEMVVDAPFTLVNYNHIGIIGDDAGFAGTAFANDANVTLSSGYQYMRGVAVSILVKVFDNRVSFNVEFGGYSPQDRDSGSVGITLRDRPGNLQLSRTGVPVKFWYYPYAKDGNHEGSNLVNVRNFKITDIT